MFSTWACSERCVSLPLCPHTVCGLNGKDYKPICCAMFCIRSMDRVIKSVLWCCSSSRKQELFALVAGVITDVAPLCVSLFIPAGWSQLKHVKQLFLSLMESSLKRQQVFQVRIFKCINWTWLKTHLKGISCFFSPFFVAMMALVWALLMGGVVSVG